LWRYINAHVADGAGTILCPRFGAGGATGLKFLMSAGHQKFI